MKSRLILLVILCLSTAIFAEGLVYDEILPLVDHPNIRMTDFCRTFTNGNSLLVYNKMHLGVEIAHIQLINPQQQLQWEQPILVQDLVVLETRPDDSFSLIRTNNVWQPIFYLDTYDQSGTQIPALSNIAIANVGRDTPLLKADNLGGLHLLSYRFFQIDYSYINAEGEEISTLILPYMNSEYEPEWMFCNDQGLLLACSIGKGLRFTKIGANHEVAWTREYPRDQNVKSTHLRVLADGTAYIIWEEANLINVQKVAANGNLLWANPWQSDANMKCWIEAVAVAETGNLVLHYYQKSTNYDGLPFFHAFDVINPAGNSIESYMEEYLNSRFNRNFKGNIIFDSSGGWFFVAHGKNTQYPQIYVQHFDGSQPDWQNLIVLPAYSYTPGLSFARWDGENLQIIYLAADSSNIQSYGNYCSICYQKIDSAANLLYPGIGREIVGGKNSKVQFIKHLGLANGCLFVAWFEQKANIIYYQVIKPNGEKYYPEPQSFGMISYSSAFELCETDAGEVLLIRTSNSTKYIQKIDLETGTEWETEGKAFPAEAYSYYQGALYTGRAVQNEIYLQRYVDGYPVWEGDGIVVGALRDEYEGNALRVSSMKDNCLIWSQCEGYVNSMSFVNYFYENGSTQYSPEEAPILAGLFEEYVGCSPKEIYQHDNGWTVLTNMEKWVWEQEGHSHPGYWGIASIPYYMILDAEGLPLYPPISSPRYAYSYVHNNIIYGFSNGIFLKRDLIQNTTLQIAIPNITIQKQVLLGDGRLLWYGKKATPHTLHLPYHYGFIDAEGNIDIPEESYVSRLDCNAIIQTEYGVYFSLGCYDQAPHIQYFEVVPWQDGGGNHTPAPSLNLRNYPNPFNPSTNIVFTLPEAGLTTLEIFNLKGQKVGTILDEYQPKGKMVHTWQGVDKHGKKLPSGVYFCRLKSGKYEQVKKMLLMK